MKPGTPPDEIGSADAANIMGVGYKTVWSEWAERVGILEPKDEPDEIMANGAALQEAIVRLYAKRHGYGIEHGEQTYRRGWMRATPDAMLLQYVPEEDRSQRISAEVKCVTTQPPDVPRVGWLVQVLHQMYTLQINEALMRDFWKDRRWGISHAILCFGALRLVEFPVPWHQGAIDRLLREEERFLERVATHDPPPVCAADAAVLAKAWPWVKGEVKRLDVQALNVSAAFEAWKREEETAQKERLKWEAELKALIGDHEEAVLPDGTRYRFKPYTVEAQLRRQYTARPLKRLGGPREESE
jgi:predicted phage-related endonuclease